MTITLPVWPYAYGEAPVTGKIRCFPEDFSVEELPSFEPSGEGEHVFLRIQKSGENTDYVAGLLAKFAKVRQGDVGYAGLKDRHAVATQWFSVWLPGKAGPDWAAFGNDSIKVLQSTRHARKLKRGALAGNRFSIIIREWQGDIDAMVNKLELIKANGIPNYYGEQRFGHGGRNVGRALAMFTGNKVNKTQRGLYLSAARSFLFNQILSARVNNGTWNQGLTGEVYQIDGSNSRFQSAQPDADILHRLAGKTIHPTGALYGKGDSGATSEALSIEQNAIATHRQLADGLINFGMDIDRRALRVNVDDLSWQVNNHVITLAFALPAGSYATALLRELIRQH